MAENKDLVWIKKHYSEKLMHICREQFPTILEKEGLLPKLLSDNFAQTSSLGEDLENWNKIDDFKSFIFSLIDVENNMATIANKTPEELMDEAGYVLFPECKTEEDIQSFRHYYSRGDGTATPIYNGGEPEYYRGEELCTFNGGRLNYCRVWFAVKKEVLQDENAIKRAERPTRQDDYGTSVLSIQFSKDGYQTLSIKNRYNHTVNQPDATFSNNLDNIIPGLEQAFCHKYNLSIQNNSHSLELSRYVKANDGKFYRYNYEINNIYYCENNVIIDNGSVKKLDNRYVLADYFIIDQSTKKVTLYDNSISDSFIDGFSSIDGISIERNKDKKIIRFKKEKAEDIILTLNKHGEIIEFADSNLTKCGAGFLRLNEALQKLSLPNLTKCGNYFLYNNNSLQELSLPNLTQCGINFLLINDVLQELSLPNLTQCGDYFLYFNKALKELSLPNLTQCGDYFLYDNMALKELSLPNLTQCGDYFLYFNKALKELSLPNLTQCGDYFLYDNMALKELSLPNLTQCGDYFLYFNKALKELSLPNLTQCGDNFLLNNESLQTLNLPNLTECGDGFLRHNNSLQELNLPNLCNTDMLF